ncbi:MAG: redoxin domain-containing protein [Bacteroidota bacterium]|nr:redoxin domain-containing protein [Bacteroidota bacterium]
MRINLLKKTALCWKSLKRFIFNVSDLLTHDLPARRSPQDAGGSRGLDAKPFRKVTVLTVFYVTLLTFIFFYSCKNNESIKPKKEKFENIISLTIDGKIINSDSLQGSLRVFVFFSPNDCQSCLNEILFWNSNQKIFEQKLSVVGIVSHRYREIAARFVKMLNIDIPVIFDGSSNIKMKYGITHTPGRIIFNNENEIIHKSDINNKNVRLESIVDTIKVLLNL